MAFVFQIFDAAGNLLVDQDTLVFRILGTQRIVGTSAGNPDVDSASSGSIVDDGFLTGTPFCETVFCGTADNGIPSSWDPLAPVISFSGNTLTYNYLWGDWVLTYGVA